MNDLGWVCPRCGKVWAPSVRHCDCSPEPPYQVDPFRPVPHFPYNPNDSGWPLPSIQCYYGQ